MAAWLGSIVGMAAWSTYYMAMFDGSIVGMAAWLTYYMGMLDGSIAGMAGPPWQRGYISSLTT